MKSAYPVTRLSSGPAAIHRYYDVPCESPDGRRILYFRFNGAMPGPGDLIVANRDGTGPRVAARIDEPCLGHVGGQATWIDDDTISYIPRGQRGPTTCILSLSNGSAREIEGWIRQYHPDTGAAVLVRAPGETDDPFTLKRRVRLDRFDANSGERCTILTLEQAARVHPLDIDVRRMNFMNSKWSPDGATVSVVFTDQIYADCRGERRTVKSIILADAGGSNARYLCEFTHHPIWTPDGTAVVAHRKTDDGRQDLVRFPLHGSPPTVLIEDYVGIHSTLNAAMTHVITDAFRYPERGNASVLRYDLASGEREVLCTGRQGDFSHETGSHPHPRFAHGESAVIFNMADEGGPQVYSLRLPPVVTASPAW